MAGQAGTGTWCWQRAVQTQTRLTVQATASSLIEPLFHPRQGDFRQRPGPAQRQNHDCQWELWLFTREYSCVCVYKYIEVIWNFYGKKFPFGWKIKNLFFKNCWMFKDSAHLARFDILKIYACLKFTLKKNFNYQIGNCWIFLDFS